MTEPSTQTTKTKSQDPDAKDALKAAQKAAHLASLKSGSGQGNAQNGSGGENDGGSDGDNDGPRAQKMNKKDVIRRDVLRRLGGVYTIAEVGVWRGRFSEVLLDELNPQKLYLVDPWKAFTTDTDTERALVDDKNAKQMESIYQFVHKRFDPQIASGQVEILRDLSEHALKRFPDHALDLIYIDGDHSYEGVCKDLAIAVKKVRKGGFIMLDDYHRRGWWGDDVQRAVHEFIGAHVSLVRIHAVVGAQIALQVDQGLSPYEDGPKPIKLAPA